MRIIIILIALVILLVAVSWFKPAYCTDAVSDSLIKNYLEEFRPQKTGEKTYNSPEIYGASQTPPLPIQKETQPVSNIKPPESNAPSVAELEPFGYSLFSVPSELSAAPEIADAADYILGPGDNIVIYLWGKVEKEYNLTVDRQGKLFIPKVGEIVVWGLTLADFEAAVNRKFSSVYSDFKSSVSLGKIRSIRIYLTGEVKRPGAYTVSSLTTLFNALYLAGGPNLRGSMRNIQLIRKNEIVTTLDLYQFLLKGDSKSDIRLSSGDAIFIPVTGPRVRISGAVKRPAIYELLGNETVSSLLGLAGGTAADAYLDRIMLERFSPEDEKEVIDVNLNGNSGKPVNDIALADGDRVAVFSLYDMKRNVVYIDGLVKHPGEFERTDSTTIRDLLKLGELQPKNVYYDRANLFRRYPDRREEVIPVNLNQILSGQGNFLLQDLDSLHVYSIDEVKRRKYVYIDGEVKKPGEYLLYDNMNLADLVFLAGDLKKNAYQLGFEIARTDSLGRVRLEYIDLSKTKMEAVLLLEDDRVFVRQIPDWFLHRSVIIEGEVQFPGQYALLSRTETLYDLLSRAGGFTERAFPKGIIFQRESISRDLVRKNLPEMVQNSQPLHADSTGQFKKVEIVNLNLESMNRVIIDVDRIIDSKGSRGNVTLQNGDRIYVPQIPSGISVMGAVGANGTIKYESGKKVEYYVKRAGSFTRQANKKETRLIKADGRVFAGNGTLRRKVDIGDAIVVPSDIKQDRDWLKTISSAVSIVGGILTSVFIIDKL